MNNIVSAFVCHLRNLRYFPLFNIDSKCHNCASAKSKAVTSAVCRGVGIFKGKSVLLNDLLC
jgi:hypothetical protein